MRKLLIYWLPPRDSNPDMLIQSQKQRSKNKQFSSNDAVKRDQVRSNPHTGRTRSEDA
jgi:hypothetical protein